MMKILMVVLALVLVAGCSNSEKGGSKSDETVFFFNETNPVLVNNGGVALNITGMPESCKTSTFHIQILCGTRTPAEECWKKKVELYVNKTVQREGCCFPITDNAEMCCSRYMQGTLERDKNGEESISLNPIMYGCSVRRG